MNKIFLPIKYLYTTILKIRMTPFRGSHINLENSKYNRAWDNERSIEVPLIQNAYESLGINKFNKNKTNILEIGNVLSNYERKLSHDIVDKYETHPQIKNVDFLDFTPNKKYDYIFSISTFEHIGFDCGEKPDASKSTQALKKVLKMLKPKGRVYITIPVGFNIKLDKAIVGGIRGYNTIAFKRTCNWGNAWEQCSIEDASKYKYGTPYPNANAIFVLFRDMNKYNIVLDSEELLCLAGELKEIYEYTKKNQNEFSNEKRILGGIIPKLFEKIREEQKFIGSEQNE